MNMKTLKHFVALLLIPLIFSCKSTQELVTSVSAPAGSSYTKIDRNGTTVIPNGRLLTPMGRSIEVAPHPFGLALSRDGRIAVTANSGVSPISISIVRDILESNPTVHQVPPGPSTDKGVLASVFMGLAVSPDGGIVYVAGGQANRIYLFDTGTGARLDSIDCSFSAEGKSFPDGYIGDLVLTSDGKYLYAVDQTNFRLLIVNVDQKNVIRSVPMGRYPFGIALSPLEDKVYVANVGMFEYRKIDTIEETRDFNKALKFPAFPFGSEEMKKGTRIDSLDIPGLGDPNVPESFSVWVVSVKDPFNPAVTAKIKTGVLVGEKVEGIPAVGGSSPNSIAATSTHVFVSNGNNDNISVIDIRSDKIVREIALKPHDAVKHFRGVIPFGLAVSPDEKRLYVAEAGINALGVIDLETFRVMGHLPVGWFPSKLKVTGDGKKLIVANAKGYGSGPNGGKAYAPGPEGTYIGNLMKGTVSVLEIPSDQELEVLTGRVVANNFKIESVDDGRKRRGKNPVPLYGGETETPIKHLVFISKENRTYDEVFGQVGEGDASVARYGRNVTFSNRKKTVTVEDATIMANHLNLAKRFSIADNFYVDADVSADGHRWLVNTYPNEWVESTAPASYGENRSYRANLKAPGSLAMTGSAGAIYPEDYNEAGSLWEHMDRNGVDFFNFGFGMMFEPAFYNETFKQGGVRHYVNYPVPAPMFDRTSRIYPTYNMAIPDQFRVSLFIKEFNEKWGENGSEMPQVLTVIIPNDHGAGERPEAGYPFRESYMVDNDLAVGRIVEFLSHTKYWKNMAIVITEDDAQNGVDHIDAHRSILMVISPYAKKNYVSKVHYSFGSIFKTFFNILGLPYLNQYDAGATDLSDMFTETPDLTPYVALPPDLRIFDPQKALTPLDEKFDWKALHDSPDIDNPEDMLKDQKEKREYRIQDQKKENE